MNRKENSDYEYEKVAVEKSGHLTKTRYIILDTLIYSKNSDDKESTKTKEYSLGE